MRVKKSYMEIKGRESFSIFLNNWFRLNIFTLLSQLFILLITPFFFFTSCYEINNLNIENNANYFQRNEAEKQLLNHHRGEVVDIFIYNTENHILDSYTRTKFTDYFSEEAFFNSRDGRKIIVIIHNPQHSDYVWEDIKTLEAIKKLNMNLELEDSNHRTTYGIYESKVGGIIPNEIETSPLSASIQINSISCDFRNKVYNGSSLTDVKFYLINISSNCKLFETRGNPSSMLNCGGLISSDLENMADPELIYKEYKGIISYNKVYPNVKLYCYPNQIEEESIGTEFTKLVIEGKIDGTIYYYPIDINRGDFTIENSDDHIGVKKSYNYTFDIVIKETGMDSPYKSINKEFVEFRSSIKEWDDQEEIIINY